MIVSHKDYTLETFRGGDQHHCLICQNSKTCLPTALQKKTLDWYREMLCNPGENHKEHNIHKHFDWKSLPTTIHNVCNKFPTCQIFKKRIRSMVSCHPNRPKPIPGSRYMYTSLSHTQSLGKEKKRSNCGASQ